MRTRDVGVIFVAVASGTSEKLKSVGGEHGWISSEYFIGSGPEGQF